MSDSKAPRRAYVETYGCQMNVSDGELMEGILAADGWTLVDAPEDADVVLVNTCAIREHAEQRVLGRVGQLAGLKKDNPSLRIGVTGCMAQRMGEALLERADQVDLVMGPDGYRGLPGALAALRRADASGPAAGDSLSGPATVPTAADPDLPGSATDPGAAVPGLPGVSEAPSGSGRGRVKLSVLDLNLGENYEGLEQRRRSGVTAWIPVQRGCDHRCTFCIVPYVRGGEKNRRPDAVLDEVRAIAASGVTEVTLLGQTVNSYNHGGWSFPRLLAAVARVPGIRRVRFTSPHPNDVTPELVEVMAGEEAVCEQLHLPVQSGSDQVLKRMLRRYTTAAFLEKVDMVREAIPEIALSTDVIVAFPGESEEDFEATLDLMRRVRFDDAFTYRYSPREGTPATRMPAEWFLSDDVGQARLERLIEVSRGIQASINAGEVGRVEEVLVEKEARDPGQVLGRTRRSKVVVFDGDPSWIGTYRTVVLQRTTGATFVGRPTDEPARVESA
ncbi:MAG: MiaB/RimO family radical SAM methylthiotransferase [Gemmatimonadetes bacterium]|nr:MiaB/RimO family radical SAM methylthiotransferase [Gemmatimonadota bacterium]